MRWLFVCGVLVGCQTSARRAPQEPVPSSSPSVIAAAPSAEPNGEAEPVADRAPEVEDAGASSDPAHDFSLPAVNSGTARIEPGKVTLVGFGASWCAPCEKSFPVFDAIAKKYSGRLAVVALMEDSGESEVRSFVKKTGVKFPVAWDQDGAVAAHWKLNTLPTEYVIDRRGVVRFVHAGYDGSEGEKIEKELQTLLAEP